MADNAPLIERAFSIEVHEGSADLSVEGVLPPFLSGTAYWNGPGRFARGSLQYRHWLDGDGLVCALAFRGGGARTTARYVRSEKFVAEESAGRALFRQFGTAFPGDQLKRGIGIESPANVSAYPYGGALLAFGEQGLPWALDPQTLETRGLFTFNGQLNEITPFSAHPKFDHRTGEMSNFGVAFAAERPMLNLFRFDRSGGLIYRKRHALPYPASIHDFAVSASYAVFYVSPLVLDMAALMQGGATILDALRWEPERGSRLMVVSRESGELVASLSIGHKYCLHLVNAFETDGRLVVDVVEYERPIYDQYQVIPSLFTNVPTATPVRHHVDVQAARLIGRQELSYSCAPDFPAHDLDLTGLPYRDFWMLGIGTTGKPGRKFLNQLVRFDWETGDVEIYQAPPLTYLGGEPLFVPDPAARRNGVVVCQAFDAERIASSFVVFDAFNVSRGPLATLGLPSAVPLLFHSSYLAR